MMFKFLNKQFIINHFYDKILFKFSSKITDEEKSFSLAPFGNFVLFLFVRVYQNSESLIYL